MFEMHLTIQTDLFQGNNKQSKSSDCYPTWMHFSFYTHLPSRNEPITLNKVYLYIVPLRMRRECPCISVPISPSTTPCICCKFIIQFKLDALQNPGSKHSCSIDNPYVQLKIVKILTFNRKDIKISTLRTWTDKSQESLWKSPTCWSG